MKKYLFETIFREASKERFIKQLCATYGKDIYGPNNSPCPTSEVLTKFVDGPGSNKGYDWNKLSLNLLKQITNDYWNYKAAGGSNKEKKAAALKDPNNIFKTNSVKVSFGSDCSGCDIQVIKSLENERYIFAVPLTWEGAKFMDSSECGGAGAQWCIGYEKTDDYWADYVDDGNLFIMALDKETYRTKNDLQNKLKYMIQIAKDSIEDCQGWKQVDDPEDTLYPTEIKEKFGYDINQLAEAIAMNCIIYGYFDSSWLNDDSDGVREDLIYSDRLLNRVNVLSVDKLKDLKDGSITLGCLKKIVIDFNGMTNITSNVYNKNYNGNSFDTIDFSDWLYKKFSKESINELNYPADVVLKNGDFNEMIIEPEAHTYFVKYKNKTYAPFDIILENCYISRLYWYVLDYASTISLYGNDNTRVNTVHFMNEYVTNTSTLDLQCDYEEEYDEEEYEEEDE